MDPTGRRWPPLLDMLVGTQQRLLIYPEQGFMIRQEVPDSVATAYEHLCSEGFTSRLVPADQGLCGPVRCIEAAGTAALLKPVTVRAR